MEEYYADLLRIDPTLSAILGDKSDFAQRHYTNNISDQYINKFKKILEKYKNTTDPVLKYIINLERESFKHQFEPIHFVPITNPINDFKMYNDTLYKPGKLAYLSRQRDFDAYIKSCVQHMRRGIRIGVVLPKIICDQLIQDIVDPHYFWFRDFLIKEYKPKCRESIGLCDMTSGNAMYKFLIKATCTFDIDPVTIHAYGKKEVTRILQLQKTVKHVENTYCKSRREMLSEFRKHYKHINTVLMPKYFHMADIPKTVCKIKAMPKHMEASGAGGNYYPNMETFYVNARDLKEHAKENMYTLTLHETVPGHHFQFAHYSEKKLSLAKQFAVGNTALDEGWALYAETLGPQNAGSLASQMFRAVRLVVDTGIHHYGWSFDQALAYMMKYLPYKESEMITEIKRYISIPAQALAYALGKQHIVQLRDSFIKHKLGDIRDFHAFLFEDGTIPFELIDAKLWKKIKAYKGVPTCKGVCN